MEGVGLAYDRRGSLWSFQATGLDESCVLGQVDVANALLYVLCSQRDLLLAYILQFCWPVILFFQSVNI